MTSDHVARSDVKSLRVISDHLRSWALNGKRHVSDQEYEQVQSEINRLQVGVNFFQCKKKIQQSRKEVPADLQRKISANSEAIVRHGPFYEQDLDRAKKVIQEARSLGLLSTLDVTEEERLDIVKAMGLSQGHWFKCKNGEFCSFVFSNLIFVTLGCLWLSG